MRGRQGRGSGGSAEGEDGRFLVAPGAGELLARQRHRLGRCDRQRAAADDLGVLEGKGGFVTQLLPQGFLLRRLTTRVMAASITP